MQILILIIKIQKKACCAPFISTSLILFLPQFLVALCHHRQNPCSHCCNHYSNKSHPLPQQQWLWKWQQGSTSQILYHNPMTSGKQENGVHGEPLLPSQWQFPSSPMTSGMWGNWVHLLHGSSWAFSLSSTG